MTTVDTTISRLLDKHKPAGAKWVVWINDQGFKSCYGPFDEYDAAAAWQVLNTPLTGDGEVLPLYERNA